MAGTIVKKLVSSGMLIIIYVIYVQSLRTWLLNFQRYSTSNKGLESLAIPNLIIIYILRVIKIIVLKGEILAMRN